ncbi:Peptidase S8/S53 domain - like 10 [Theobroma cacao]|nr:Peptidase S8/S53 domain - like 10 [Theobroma cacao]
MTDYAIICGTSTSFPRAAGIAKLLRATHRDWSSVAIRSAMMTTADNTDNANGRIIDMIIGVRGTPLDFGAVNPNKTMEPGFDYDIENQDYHQLPVWVKLYENTDPNYHVAFHYAGDNASQDLNYPSLIVILKNTNTTCITFQKKLANCGRW